MKEQIRQSSQRRSVKISHKRQVIDFIKKEKLKNKTHRSSKKDPNKVGYSVGQWTRREIGLYIKYIITHKTEFTNPILRKKKKVFIKLAHFIGSRTADQCRSHHQKVSLKFQDIEQQIQFYEHELAQNLESKKYDKMQNHQQNQIDVEMLKQQEKSISQDVFEQNVELNLIREWSPQAVDLKICHKGFNNQQKEDKVFSKNKEVQDKKTTEVIDQQPYHIECEGDVMKILIEFNIIDQFQ